MALQVINVGSAPNDGQGDAIRTAYIKCNNNFAELYSRAQTNPPATNIGTAGDTAGMYAYDSNYFYYCYGNYDGSSTIWAEVAQLGNVAATTLSSGNSNVAFSAANGNIIFSVHGTANAAMVRSDGLYTGGNVTGGNIIGGIVSSTGNITSAGNVSGNYLLGNVFYASGISASKIFNGTSEANIGTSGGNANITIGGTSNVVVVYSGGVSVTGDLTVTGNATLTGNILGDRILNGTTELGIQTASGNANLTIGGTSNVVVWAPAGQYVSGLVSVSGNVTSAANVTGSNLLTGGLISATGNVTGGNVLATTIVSGASLLGSIVSVSGNVTGGNINTAGQVSAAGNVIGQYLKGDGSQISNISVSAGAQIINGTSNVSVGSSANITVAVAGTSNVVVWATTGEYVTGVVSASGNVHGANFNTAGLVSATGNLTGGNVLTGGLISSTANITGGNVLTGGLISSTGNITGGNLSVSTGTVTLGSIVNANSNRVGNIGSATTYFNTIFGNVFQGTATTAQYADLAEKYVADAAYEPGTVIVIGGAAEVTASTKDADRAVVGVVSTQPAYTMNSGLDGEHIVTVALVGRVPCKVQGPIAKGDLLVSTVDGRAKADPDPKIGSIVGKALENFNEGTGVIEIIVGKL